MLLENVIISFPELFTPKKIKDAKGRETGDPRFGLQVLLPPDHPQLNELWNLVETKKTEAFPSGFPNDAYCCLVEYDQQFKGKEYYMPECSGWWVLMCYSKQTNPPQVAVFNAAGQPQKCIDPGAAWSGQLAYVDAGIYSFDVSDGGVAAGLNGVLLTGVEGQLGRIDGKKTMDQMFAGVKAPTKAPGAGPGAPRPAGPGAPAAPRPAGPGAPAAPGRVAPPAPRLTPPPPPAKKMTAIAQATYEEYRDAGWTDQQLIEAGLMEAPSVQPV